jgi:hypothetical protein
VRSGLASSSIAYHVFAILARRWVSTTSSTNCEIAAVVAVRPPRAVVTCLSSPWCIDVPITSLSNRTDVYILRIVHGLVGWPLVAALPLLRLLCLDSTGTELEK